MLSQKWTFYLFTEDLVMKFKWRYLAYRTFVIWRRLQFILWERNGEKGQDWADFWLTWEILWLTEGPNRPPCNSTWLLLNIPTIFRQSRLAKFGSCKVCRGRIFSQAGNELGASLFPARSELSMLFPYTLFPAGNELILKLTKNTASGSNMGWEHYLEIKTIICLFEGFAC